MDENRAKGVGRQISGSLKEAGAKVAGGAKAVAEGATVKAVAKAQDAVGGDEDRVRENGTTIPSAAAGSARPAGLMPSQTEGRHVVEEQVIPLYTEEVAVSRRNVDRAVVRVATVTHEHPTLVDEQLTHERVEVERVAVNRMIDAVPPVREEGDTTIIPVVEEIMVVERRLLLKEEVRLTKVRVTEQYRETFVLRDQDVVVTRTAASDGQAQARPSPRTP